MNKLQMKKGKGKLPGIVPKTSKGKKVVGAMFNKAKKK